MNVVKQIIAFVFYYTGAIFLLKFLFCLLTGNKGLVVLAYHRVVEPDQRDGSLPEMTVSPDMFEENVSYLSRNYILVGINDYLEKRTRKRGIFCHPRVLITFDDGWEDNYSNAFPILHKYGIPALIFLTTRYIETSRLFWPERLARVLRRILSENTNRDLKRNAVKAIEAIIENRRKKHTNVIVNEGWSIEKRIKSIVKLLYFVPEDRIDDLILRLSQGLAASVIPEEDKEMMLNWNQVNEMARDGVIFGSHTCNHYSLDRLGQEEVSYELEQSKLDIEEHTGICVKTLAFPNGHYNLAVLKIARKIGYEVAFTTKTGINTRRTPGFELKRVRFDDSLSQGSTGKFSRSLFEFHIWRNISPLRW